MFSRLVIILLFSLSVLSSGCALKHSYTGQYINPDDTILIKADRPYTGVWETFDLRLDYEYNVDDGLLVVNGMGELGQHHQIIYDRVRYLWLYVLLLDGDNNVLESHTVPTYMTLTRDRFRFNRIFKLDRSVKGLSFAYDGYVSEFDGHSHFKYP